MGLGQKKSGKGKVEKRSARADFLIRGGKKRAGRDVSRVVQHLTNDATEADWNEKPIHLEETGL